MSVKTTMTGMLAAAVLSLPAIAGTPDEARVFRQARNLYESGMYERARTLFETMPGDPVSEGYAVLCAICMRSSEAADLMEAYESANGETALTPQIVYRNALNLFDDGNYAAADEEFSRIGTKQLRPAQRAEYTFKRGYCDYTAGDYDGAKVKFYRLEKMPKSDFSAPALYLTGLIDYTRGHFKTAEESFSQAASDPRFRDLSAFYMVDCEFNQGNYDYVIENGEAIYADSPEERQVRLARIISESYLIKGNKAKAREFFRETGTVDVSRADLFYAGTVLYGVDDYQGAIDNYSRMTERTDSIGQIANYHLGNSYLHIRNQVAAMDAFRDAVSADYDSKMTEDAFFNYAKLAFDLNKDTSGFAEYIKRYSTTRRGESIYGYMALAALYDHDYERAVEAYDNIEELSPDMLNNYTKANYLRANQLVGNGAYRDAIPCLRASAYYLPRNDRLNQLSRYWLAESYYSTDNLPDALKVYEDLYNASALDGKDEGAMLPYNIAYCHYGKGDYTAAAKWFDTYLAGGHRLQREDALVRRADCDFARRDYKASIISFQACLDEYDSPNKIYPYYRQAISYGLSGDRKKKVAVLSRVEKASPSAPLYNEAMYELGRANMDIKNNSDAVRVFTNLRTTTTDSVYVAKALIGLGMVNRNVGEYDKALEHYKKVVAMMPGSEYAEDALLAIESIYQTRKEPEKYLEYVEKNSLAASKSAEEKEQMYFNTAEQVYLAGNWREAIVTLQKYLDSYPEGSRRQEAFFYMADSHKALGNKEKACDTFAKVIEMGGEGPFVESSLLNYADISYGLERYQDAYKGYSGLLYGARMEANRAVARTGMMRSAFRGRDYDSAVAAAQLVCSDTGSSEDLKREATYIQAKSFLSTSKRADALSVFRSLSAEPSTKEGAEACYILIQDTFDKGEFDKVESMVYDFSGKSGDQSYWLAKAFIVLGDSFAARDMNGQARATFESIRDGYVPTRGDDDVRDNVKLRLERLPQ